MKRLIITTVSITIALILCISVTVGINTSQAQKANEYENVKTSQQTGPPDNLNSDSLSEQETGPPNNRDSESLSGQETGPPVQPQEYSTRSVYEESTETSKPTRSSGSIVSSAVAEDNASPQTTPVTSESTHNSIAVTIFVPPPPDEVAQSPPASQVFSWDRGGTYNGAISIREATAPGIKTESNEHAVVDYSNASSGYVMVKVTAGVQGKVIILGPGMEICERALTLRNDNQFYPISLQYGSGEYTIVVAVYGDNEECLSVLNLTLSVQLSQADISYLYPGLYANYNASSAVVRKSFDLCMNATNELEKVQSIYGYIAENFVYSLSDAQLQNDYVPNLDRALNSQSGACSDIAGLMTAMCRAQGIKTRLIFGYSFGKYHAWVEVYIPQSGLIAEGIYSNGGWKRLDPTYALSMTAEQIENAQYIQREVF
jgi:hypothetical protein